MNRAIYNFIVPGVPKGKGRPRFARQGKFVRTFTDSQTLSKESEIKWYAVQANIPKINEGQIVFTVKAFVSIPKSFSLKKRVQAESNLFRPVTRPDIDNYLKLAADALNDVVWKDDSMIVEAHAYKYYSDKPRLDITIEVHG